MLFYGSVLDTVCHCECTPRDGEEPSPRMPLGMTRVLSTVLVLLTEYLADPLVAAAHKIHSRSQ